MEENQTLSATLARLISAAGNTMAERRGVPLIVGFFLVILNFICQFIPALGWFGEYDVLLHLGLLFSIGGSLLAPVL